MSLAKKKLREDNRIDNWSYLWMAMFTGVGFLLFNVLYSFFGAFVLKIFAAVIIVGLIGGLLYSKWKKSDSERKTIYVILLISIVLRLCYVIITSGTNFTGQDYDTFVDVQTNLTLPEAFQGAVPFHSPLRARHRAYCDGIYGNCRRYRHVLYFM